MWEDISIKILPIPHWTFTCYLKNVYKSTQARCKVRSNLTSVLEQLTFVLLVSFLLTLNTFHTLLWCYYSPFEKVNVDWQCAVIFCQNNTVILTYTHNHASHTLLWRCSCHRNQKQNSKSFFNYDANLTLVITMELKFIFFLCDVGFSVWRNCVWRHQR